MRWILLAATLCLVGVASAQEPATTAPPTLDAALRLPAELEFQDTSLAVMASKLSQQFGINVLLAEKSLADAAIDPKHKISRKVKGETLGGALTALLAPNELAWTRQGEVLLITTKESGGWDRTTHIYRLVKGKPTEFCERLKKEYRPEDWRHGTGEYGAWRPWDGKPAMEDADPPPNDDGDRHGSVAIYGTAIVIAHAHADHFAIQQKYKDELLLAAADESTLVPLVLMRRQDFEFQDAKLCDVVDWLAKDTKLLRVVLDENALREAEISNETRVSVRLKNVPYCNALDLLLEPHELAWSYHFGTLSITTREVDETPETASCIIDTRGLFIQEFDFDSLHDLLETSTPFWDERSGGFQNFDPVEPHYILCKIPYRYQRNAVRIAEELRAALKKPRE